MRGRLLAASLSFFTGSKYASLEDPKQTPTKVCIHVMERIGQRRTWRVFPMQNKPIKHLPSRKIHQGVIASWPLLTPTTV